MPKITNTKCLSDNIIEEFNFFKMFWPIGGVPVFKRGQLSLSTFVTGQWS